MVNRSKNVQQKILNITKMVYQMKKVVIVNFLFLMLCGIVSMLFQCSSPLKKVYFVSPHGNDSNPGTKKAPFASFGKAIKALSTVYRNGYSGDVTVYFREGIYTFDKTVIIGPADVPHDDSSKILFSAYKNERPVFSAGKRINTWEKVDELPEGFVDAAKGKLWVTTINECKDGMFQFKVLFNGEKHLSRARSQGYLPASKNEDGKTIGKRQLHYPEGSIKKWDNLRDVEIVVRPATFWLVNILPIASVDEEKNIAYTSVDATYPMTCMYWVYDDIPETFWVENVPEALDEPGEWILNSKTGKLYLWPEGEEPGENMYYPLLQELIHVKGNDQTEEIIRNITFKGITFCHGERDTWEKDDIGLQHDWEMYDESNAMLRFQNVENCYVDNCVFRTSGGTGIRFDFQALNNKVINNKLYNLGATGILFCGYGPGGNDVNKQNEIVNNEIHNCGLQYWHSPAIFISQSGENRIAHNLIYNLPYNGIVLSGVRPHFFEKKKPGRELTGTIQFDEIGELKNWYDMIPYLYARNNIVEYNEIHNVMEKLSDGNGIYMSATGPGNIIRRNYLHDILHYGAHGIIRADDFTFDATITENIIYRFCNEGIEIKHPNIVTNNYVINHVDCNTPWGRELDKNKYIHIAPFGNMHGTVIKRNIFYHKGKQTAFYFLYNGFFRLEVEKEPELTDCIIDSNLYYSAADLSFCESYLQDLQDRGLAQHGIAADPLFEAVEENNFRLKKNSPALKLGIKQIDLQKIGLLQNNYK